MSDERCECYARHQKGGRCLCLCHPVNRLDAAGLLPDGQITKEEKK